MSTEIDTKEILKRLQALEEENAKLGKVTSANAVKPLTVIEGEYMGHPTLTFEGPCKPFTIGLKKLSIIKQAWSQVEQFLEQHSQTKIIKPFTDDIKI